MARRPPRPPDDRLVTELDAVRDLVAHGALFFLNDSGGKDSQAQRIRVLQVVPREQLVVMHATLGDVEWPGALEHARDGAERAGVPFVVAAARKSFFELVEHRARTYPHAPAFPQPGNRQCTSDLKRDPLTREARRIARARGATLLVTCLGLRADESAKRRARAPLVRSARNSKGGRSWYEWLPVHHLTTPQVFATIREAGEVPHPAYAWGNARLSCMFCIIGCAADARHAAIRNPDLYARYIELETRTGHTLHPSRKTLVEVTGLTVEVAREAHAQLARREARRLPVLAA